MTIDEYVQEIRRRIRTSRSREGALGVLEEAARTLEQSNISQFSKRKFWADLYESFTLTERQGASALSAIIAAAQAAIAKRLDDLKK